MYVFEVRGKPEYPGENWSTRGKNWSTRGKTGIPGEKTCQSREKRNQQTQPAYDAESGNRTRGTLARKDALTTTLQEKKKCCWAKLRLT